MPGLKPRLGDAFRLRLSPTQFRLRLSPYEFDAFAVYGPIVSVTLTRALVESATLIARPTPRAPGILDFASMLSRCRSVSVSLAPARRAPPFSPPPQAATRASRRTIEKSFTGASSVVRALKGRLGPEMRPLRARVLAEPGL